MIYDFYAKIVQHACLWCEGESSLERGVPRSFGSIDLNYVKYMEDGGQPSQMQKYKNCITPRILYLQEPEDTLVEHKIPLPELHIFIGIVSMFVKLLLAAWPSFESWLQRNYIMFRGYHGIGLDGNNSQRFLQRLDFLELDINGEAQKDGKLLNLLPIISCIRAFAEVKSKSFGMEVSDDIEECVEEFKNSFLLIQNHVKINFNYDLRVSWKVHILVCHLIPFLKHNCYGLGEKVKALTITIMKFGKDTKDKLIMKIMEFN